MACHQLGTKGLPEPMLAYHQLGPHELQWNFYKNTKFSFNKMNMKILCVEIFVHASICAGYWFMHA